jgi:hypothetical protein
MPLPAASRAGSLLMTEPDFRVQIYLNTLELLARKRRWTEDKTAYRFAACVLSTTVRLYEDPQEEFQRIADLIKARAGWFGTLNSPMRYVVTAIILRCGFNPQQMLAGIERIRQGFRELKMRRGGMHEVVAAVVLILGEGDTLIAPDRLERMDRIYQRFKQHHRWLTGTEDYPAAALLAGTDIPTDQIVQEVEEAYEQLRAAGYRRGNSLQLASHVLFLHPDGPSAAVQRFCRVASALHDRGFRVQTRHYDLVSLLALMPTDADDLAEEVLVLREALRRTPGRPDKELALALAVGLVLGSCGESVRTFGGLAAMQALRAYQAILQAHAACAAAASAGACA